MYHARDVIDVPGRMLFSRCRRSEQSLDGVRVYATRRSRRSSAKQQPTILEARPRTGTPDKGMSFRSREMENISERMLHETAA